MVDGRTKNDLFGEMLMAAKTTRASKLAPYCSMVTTIPVG
jgi:hypothetical protein